MPTSTAKEIVEVFCPGTSADPRIDDFLELATAFVAEITFGDKFNQAQALVVCHFLQLESQSGGSSSQSGNGSVGGITSIKEGQLQKNFGGPSKNLRDNKLYWGQTTAGLNLMALWDACIMMPRNRMV